VSKTFLLNLLLLLPAPPLRAGTALLWIPREHAAVDDVLSRLEAGKDLKLTAAVGEIPAAAAERMKALAAEGRLELAARPAGDPPMPLFYSAGEETVRWQGKLSSSAFTNDPFFLSLRMSDARDAYTKNFRHPPDGFVSSPGGIAAGCVPLAKAFGFKWLAAGPLVSTTPFNFIDAEGISLVPFSTTPAAGGSAFLVFDETTDAPGADSRAALLDFLSSNAHFPYLTVSEALKTAVSTTLPAAQAARSLAPWSGDYSLWASGRIQTGALTALARTRTDLMAYLNAAQGDYKAAKPAFAGYFSVESGPGLLRLSDPETETAKETEMEMQNVLADVYRLMDKAPPAWLFSPLADLKEKTEDADKVTVAKSSSGFILNNSGRPPIPPAAAPADPNKAWKLARVELSWNDSEVSFSFTPLSALETPDEGISPNARFDLYIDVNNRPRAGAARLLEGRGGRIFPDNAWEYALEVSAAASTIYTFTTRGPQKAGNFQTVLKHGSFTARIPRTLLRGNPGLWSYTALMLYTRNGAAFTTTDFLAEDFSNGYYYSVRPGGK
jgi:hypothetical protein